MLDVSELLGHVTDWACMSGVRKECVIFVLGVLGSSPGFYFLLLAFVELKVWS